MAFSLVNNLKWGLLVLLAAFLLAFYGLLSLQAIPIATVYLYLAPKLGAAILLLLMGKAFIEFTLPVIDRAVKRPESRPSARSAWSVSIWFVVAFLILAVFVGDLPAAIIASSLVFLGLAFAFRRPILSLVGWLYITTRGLYSIGDVLQSSDFSGEVAHIGLFSTYIWEFSSASPGETGRFFSVPNSFIFEKPVAMLQKGEQHVWDEVSVSLPPGSDYNGARRALLKACDEAIGAKKMSGNAKEQQAKLEESGITSKLPGEPEVHVLLEGDKVVLRLRYLVEASQRSHAKSAISEHALMLMGKEGILKPRKR